MSRIRRTPFHLSTPLAALVLLVGCNTHAAVPTIADARGLGRDDAHGELHRFADACDTDGLRKALQSPGVRGVPAEVDRLDRVGMTPLAVAARIGCLPAVISLAQAGADVDHVDPATGWTPLHYAASQRHAAVVDFLLGRGALQDRKTRRGETPLALALLGTGTQFGPKGDQHTTEMVLSSGRSRARFDPTPRAARVAQAKKPAARKKAPAKKPAAKPSAAKSPATRAQQAR
jgi:hypothetical protein